MPDLTSIVGIDCATQPASVGLARAEWIGGRAYVREITLGSEVASIAELVARWSAGSSRTLLALDSPLGWPAPLGGVLAGHQAGSPISAAPDALFRRETDREIRRRFAKQPLEVGADRIARTAVVALQLLAEVGERLGAPVPLAWDPEDLPAISAVEVYPAATLLSRGVTSRGYKRADQRDVRRRMLGELRPWLDLPGELELAERSDDALDAVVCTLAGHDFLAGECAAPADDALARKEGWIWSSADPRTNAPAD